MCVLSYGSDYWWSTQFVCFHWLNYHDKLSVNINSPVHAQITCSSITHTTINICRQLQQTHPEYTFTVIHTYTAGGCDMMPCIPYQTHTDTPLGDYETFDHFQSYFRMDTLSTSALYGSWYTPHELTVLNTELDIHTLSCSTRLDFRPLTSLLQLMLLATSAVLAAAVADTAATTASRWQW